MTKIFTWLLSMSVLTLFWVISVDVEANEIEIVAGGVEIEVIEIEPEGTEIEVVEVEPEWELVAHYSFERNADDVSGNDHHGAPEGGLSYTDGIIGKAAQFDGVDDSIQLPVSEYLPQTLIAWIKPDASAGNNFMTVLDSDRCYYYGQGIEISYPNRVVQSFQVDTHNNFHETGQSVEWDTWQQVAVVYTEGNASFYHDGELIKSIDYTQQPLDGQNYTIGSHCTSDGGNFKGLVDEVRIYNAALSHSQIEEIYLQDQRESMSGDPDIDDEDPLCSPEHLEYCQTEQTCTINGDGHWCNDSCQADVCSTNDENDSCLAYNNRMTLDCFSVGEMRFQGDLALYSVEPAQFELQNVMLKGEGEPQPEAQCSVYDLFTNILNIPCITIGDGNWEIDFEIVSFDPILLGVVSVSELSVSQNGTITTTIEPSQTNQVLSPAEGLTITLPGGIFDRPETVNVTPLKMAESNDEILAGGVWDIRFSTDQINDEITLEFEFDPALLPQDIPLDALIVVVHYDSELDKWVFSPKEIDEEKGTIRVSTNTFSPWGWIALNVASFAERICTPEGHFCIYYFENSEGLTLSDTYHYESMSDVAEDIGHYLERSREKYSAAGFTVPEYLNVVTYKPFRIPLITNDNESSKIPFLTINEPHYQSGWIGQNAIYFVRTKEAMESHNYFLQTAAHELFHAVQNQHVNSFSMGKFERKWFTEATADYASFVIAGDRNIGRFRNLNAGFFSKPLSNFEDDHPYQAAQFIDYLIVEENIPFLEMFLSLYEKYFTTAIDSLEAYLLEKTGKRMGSVWETFVQKSYLNNLSMSNESYFNVESDFSEKHFSLDLMNGYTADTLLLTTQIQEQTPLRIKPDRLNVSMDGLYENWAKLFIYKISNFREEEKRTISLLNAFDRDNIAPTSQFTMNNNDRVLVLAVYDRMDMPPIINPDESDDDAVAYIYPDTNLRLDISLKKQDDETPDLPESNAIISTFDETFAQNSDRWGIGPMAPGFADGWFQSKDVAEYKTSGGNPEGYITWVGDQRDWWYFTTYSSKYSGDRSFALGKKLTFDLKTDSTNPPDYGMFLPFVVISGKDGSGSPMHLYQPQAKFGQAHFEEPGATWTSYSITLNSSADWIVSDKSSLSGGSAATDADIRQVLSTLTSLRIRGEYGSYRSTGALDNVVLGAD